MEPSSRPDGFARLSGLRLAVFLFVVVASAARAVPPVPTLATPLDGGWTQRTPSLVARMLPGIPPDVKAFGFEVQDPSGTVAWQRDEPTGLATTTVSSGRALPDAGFFTWRVRGIDDAGVVSAWSAPWTFFVDDLAPPIPANLTLAVDGGVAYLTCDPVSDTQSGLGYYHFVLSELDPLAGTFPISGDGRYSRGTPDIAIRLGPGTWTIGVHSHDAVDNYTLADGGVGVGPVFIPVWDGGASATAFVFSTRALGNAWTLPAEMTVPTTAAVSFSDGEWDVRVASHVGLLVSNWSPSTRVWVDTTAPRSPSPTASRTGNTVTVSWFSVTDTTGGSGVREYQVRRCCQGDGGAGVADVLDASVSFVDSVGPGRWAYSVSAVDRAGNVGLPGIARLDFPPGAPTGLLANPLLGNRPVTVSWDDVGDGGAVTGWTVTRVDLASDAGTVVALGLPVPRFDDAAPEGAWRWEVVAAVDGLAGPTSTTGPARVDLTAPLVATPVVTRLASRSLRVTWTVSDALSGLGLVTLERETDGAITSLGAAIAPFDDQPVDGTHRYRVVAGDLAGNITLTPWTAPFATPPGLAINAVAPVTAQCGRRVEVLLRASEPVFFWTAGGVDGVTIDSNGRVDWTPTAADVGSRTIEVTAQGSTTSDARTISVEVTCTPARFSLGCGCDSAGGLFAVLALALLRLKGAGGFLARRRGSARPSSGLELPLSEPPDDRNQ